MNSSSTCNTAYTPPYNRSFSRLQVAFQMSRYTIKQKQLPVRPAKTQISLCIRPVWSESSLPARRNLGSITGHWAHSEDWPYWADAQADLSLRMPRLIWVFAGRTDLFVGFVVLHLKWKRLMLIRTIDHHSQMFFIYLKPQRLQLITNDFQMSRAPYVEA